MTLYFIKGSSMSAKWPYFFMTFPTDQLAGLSITSRMSQRTRTEAQRERRRREREERSSLASPSSTIHTPLSIPDEHGTIRGSTRLRYQVGILRSPVQIAAIRGLTADNLSAEAAKAHELEEHGSYVAIQIVERFRLCIYASPRDGRKIDCSCPEMRNRNFTGLCPHIYWLYDRINSSQQLAVAPTIRSVAIADIENVLGQIVRRSSTDIDCLAEEISPIWTDPDEEVDREVEDMLAVLDPNREMLSGDYDEDFYDSLPVSTDHHYQDLVVPGDSFKTIFALARHDPFLRDRLATAITRERLDKDFVRKLHKRRVAAFAQLDDYVKKGTKLNPGEISLCSMKLRDITSKMEEYRQRVYETSNASFDRACAKITVRMLQEICNRNRDIYADTIWLQEASPSLPQDRNLFTCIITGWNQNLPNDNQFILNFLIDELPPQSSTTILRELTEVLSKFTEYKAPTPLIAKLERYIRDVRTEPLPPLTELDNYQSLTPSSTRSVRTDSQSSNASCSSNNSNIGSSRRHARRPSTQEMPEAQRRRLR